ncbi:kinase-like domain-containing protein [Circinella umbellata]|nr:kinase-like domain-containing protein [Circinella umbellata]
MGVFQTFFQSQPQPAPQHSTTNNHNHNNNSINNNKNKSTIKQSSGPSSPLTSSSRNMAEPNSILQQQQQQREQYSQQQQSSLIGNRFVVHEDNRHSHYLTSPTPSKLTASIDEMMDVCRGFFWGEHKMSPDALQEERSAVDKSLKRAPSKSYLTQKWGNCQEIIGKGAYGKIRVIHKNDTFYAVKEFRKKNAETTKQFIERLTNEYKVATSLHHKNIIQTFDLLPLSQTSPIYCQVMEYCNGGDLFTLVFEATDGLVPQEANCFFKQLMEGVDYLHSNHIVHRDLKPENLLLTSEGCLKISDFDTASKLIVGNDNEDDKSNDTNDNAQHKCNHHDDHQLEQQAGLVGSEPYIAPEQFEPYEYDAMAADIWSCGIIYMGMRTGNQMWQVAKQGDDDDYDRYIKFRQLIDAERQKVRRERSQRKERNSVADREAEMVRAREAIKRRAKEDGCDVFQGLEMGPKRLMYRILDPNPNKRPTVQEVLYSNEWMANIITCQHYQPSAPSTTQQQ